MTEVRGKETFLVPMTPGAMVLSRVNRAGAKLLFLGIPGRRPLGEA